MVYLKIPIGNEAHEDTTFIHIHIHGGYSVVNMRYSHAKYKHFFFFFNFIYTSARRSGDSNDSKRVCAYAQSRSSLQIVSRQCLTVCIYMIKISL